MIEKKDNNDNNDTSNVVNYDENTHHKQHQQTYLPKLNIKNNKSYQINSPQNSPNNPKTTPIQIKSSSKS